MQGQMRLCFVWSVILLFSRFCLCLWLFDVLFFLCCFVCSLKGILVVAVVAVVDVTGVGVSGVVLIVVAMVNLVNLLFILLCTQISGLPPAIQPIAAAAAASRARPPCRPSADLAVCPR